MEPGIYTNISHDAYHAMTDIISNSYLGRLDKCPAAAKIPVKETPAMIFGRAFHSFILDGQEKFDKQFIMEPIDAPKKPSSAQIRAKKPSDETIASIKWWDDFNNENRGREILSAEDIESIKSMYGAVAVHPMTGPLLLKGRSEMSIFWTDDETGLPCKCRPDRIPDGDHGVILDLKSVASADIGAFTRQCITFGYGREAGMYTEGLNAVCSAKVDAFVFICVEKEEPFRTEVYVLEDLFIGYGNKEFHRLIRIEAECRKTGIYPNWKNEGIRTLYLPNWAGGGF